MVHGCIVYTERAETAAVSHGTSHVATQQRCKYTTWVDIQKALQKVSHSSRSTYDKSAASLLESGEWRCIKRSALYSCPSLIVFTISLDIKATLKKTCANVPQS